LVTLSVAALVCLIVGLPALKLWILVTAGIVKTPGEFLIASLGGGVSLFEYGVPLLALFALVGRKSARAKLNIHLLTLWAMRVLCAVIVVSVVFTGKQTFLSSQHLGVVLVSALALCTIAIGHSLVTSFGIAPVIGATLLTTFVASLPLTTQVLQEVARNRVWNEWCPTAKDQFHAEPGPVTRVQFREMGLLPVFGDIQGQKYSGDARANVGKALLDKAYLTEYEDNNPKARFKDPLLLVRADASSGQPLIKSAASHIVTLNFSSELTDRSQHRYSGLVVSVWDVVKEKTLAERLVIQDMSGKRVCGQIYDRRIDTADFVVRALGLKQIAK
jgi:hypothetical protein